jgi:hypothetical protein
MIILLMPINNYYIGGYFLLFYIRLLYYIINYL